MNLKVNGMLFISPSCPNVILLAFCAESSDYLIVNCCEEVKEDAPGSKSLSLFFRPSSEVLSLRFRNGTINENDEVSFERIFGLNILMSLSIKVER